MNGILTVFQELEIKNKKIILFFELTHYENL